MLFLQQTNFQHYLYKFLLSHSFLKILFSLFSFIQVLNPIYSLHPPTYKFSRKSIEQGNTQIKHPHQLFSEAPHYYGHKMKGFWGGIYKFQYCLDYNQCICKVHLILFYTYQVLVKLFQWIYVTWKYIFGDTTFVINQLTMYGTSINFNIQLSLLYNVYPITMGIQGLCTQFNNRINYYIFKLYDYNYTMKTFEIWRYSGWLYRPDAFFMNCFL